VECLIKQYRDGSTVKALAEEFGIHRSTVMDHLRRHGIPRRSDSMRWTPEQLAQATSLYRQGLSAAAISSQYGLDPSTVSKRLKRAGVVLRPRPGRGRAPIQLSTKPDHSSTADERQRRCSLDCL
jgi:transposase-like protein